MMILSVCGSLVGWQVGGGLAGSLAGAGWLAGRLDGIMWCLAEARVRFTTVSLDGGLAGAWLARVADWVA